MRHQDESSARAVAVNDTAPRDQRDNVQRPGHGVATAVTSVLVQHPLGRTARIATRGVHARAHEDAEPRSHACHWDAEQVREQRLAALLDVTAALSAVRTPADIADVIMMQACALLGATSGAIRVLSADGRWLDAVEGNRYHPLLEPPQPHRSIADPFPAADALRTGRPVWISSADEWHARYPDSASPYLLSGRQAGASLPLCVDNRAIGALNLSFADPREFDEADRKFMQTLAALTAQALERTRLHAAEQERIHAAEELARLREQQAAEAEAMAQISVEIAGALEPAQLYRRLLDQCARILPCDHASVLLHDDGWVVDAASWGEITLAPGTRLFPVANVARIVARGMQGRPALIRDTTEISWIDVPPFTGAQAIRSVIVVPLVVEGVVVGTFNVDSFTPNFYTTAHLTLALRIADRITGALHNARLYEAERQRARAAEELARMRDDFVASVSHELRTPLTAIIGYAELLHAHWDAIDDVRKLTHVQQIVHAAQRQQRLVEDLLLLSTVEGAAWRPAREVLTLGDLVHAAADEVRGSYRNQQIEFTGSRALIVRADRQRALQVLVNLLDNAAKYSPEGSPIQVACEAAGRVAVVRVRDYGSGVPREGRDQLFTRFGRLAGSRSRAGRVGTGLGLYLSRQLTERMDGSLDLEWSDSDGSIFRLQLPLAADPVPGR